MARGCFIPLFLDNLGGGELVVILFFVLIFFGSKKIPELARGLGKGMRAFRNAMNDVRSDIESEARAIEKEQAPEDPPGNGQKNDPEQGRRGPEQP